MVTFTCNACGESVKKPKVETHWKRACPACNVLTCMDCGKDFVGDDYKTHNSCVSEAQKYQGKLYEGPDDAKSKGQAKQDMWLDFVQEQVTIAVASKPHLKPYLEKLLDCPNIPRKQKAFINFVKNSQNIRVQHLLNDLWGVFEPAVEKLRKHQQSKTTKGKPAPTATATSSTSALGTPAAPEHGKAAVYASGDTLPSIVDELKQQDGESKEKADSDDGAADDVDKKKKKKSKKEKKSKKDKKDKKDKDNQPTDNDQDSQSAAAAVVEEAEASTPEKKKKSKKSKKSKDSQDDGAPAAKKAKKSKKDKKDK